MYRKKAAETSFHGSLFNTCLKDIVNRRHPLVKLADAIDWASFENELEPCFCGDNGRPPLPVRLMVGLLYLKYTFNLSDDDVLAGWLENPYWQYFTGNDFFEHELPLDSSSMTRWRRHLAESGAEKMLSESIKTGLKEGFIRKTELKRVNVDTTVQEKNVRFPTDARLYDRMRERLVNAARAEGIALRQSDERVSPQALRRQSAYATSVPPRP